MENPNLHPTYLIKSKYKLISTREKQKQVAYLDKIIADFNSHDYFQNISNDRDYLVVIDTSESMRCEGNKKMRWTKQHIYNILDKFVSHKDRFGFFVFPF